MSTTDLVLPTVHLNGTSRSMLAEGYQYAYRKVADAIESLYGIEFNARDYYVKEPGAWETARRQRAEAFAHLHAVHAYLEAHLLELGE